MSAAISVLYGFIGIILGYTIPDISYKIMIYKRGEKNIEKSNNCIYSNLFKLILSVCNGGIFVLIINRINNPLTGLLIGSLITIGLIITIIDLHIRIIPNELVLAIAVLGILFQIINYNLWSIITSLACMIVMMVVFTSVAGFVGFGKVGAGDVKLAGAMGLALGYPLTAIAVLIMAIVLLIFISIGLLLKRISLATMLPMAPFMISGFIFALLTILI